MGNSNKGLKPLDVPTTRIPKNFPRRILDHINDKCTKRGSRNKYMLKAWETQYILECGTVAEIIEILPSNVVMSLINSNFKSTPNESFEEKEDEKGESRQMVVGQTSDILGTIASINR